MGAASRNGRRPYATTPVLSVVSEFSERLPTSKRERYTDLGKPRNLRRICDSYAHLRQIELHGDVADSVKPRWQFKGTN